MKTEAIAIGCVLVGCLTGTTAASMRALTDPIGSPAEIRTGFVTPIDVSGIASIDARNSANNVVIFFDIGAFNWITGIGWDVSLQTVLPTSRFDHFAMIANHMGGGSGGGFGFFPGAENTGSGGPTRFSSDGQIFEFADFGISPLFAGPDGLIRFEFFETVDDGVNLTDGFWSSGTIYIQTASPVPAPPISAMLVVAAACGCARRRSRR